MTSTDNLTTDNLTIDNDHPKVVDLSSLFRYSGMLDALRDSVDLLNRSGTATEVAALSATTQYNRLRAAICGSLDQSGVAEIELWSQELPDTEIDLGVLFLACVGLARLVDMIHQTPEFLLSAKVKDANAREVATQMERSAAKSSVLHFGMTG